MFRQHAIGCARRVWPKQYADNLDCITSDQMASACAPRLLARKWATNVLATAALTGPQQHGFTFMTWNVLADGLAQHGDFTVDPAVLTWEHRLPLIAAEIMAVNPDIFALQEVNHIEALTTLFPGFAPLYVPKLLSAATASGAPPDGTALFVSRAKFEVVDARVVYYKHGTGLANQNAIVAALREVASDNVFVISTTHLKAKSAEDARLAQLRQLLTHTERVRASTSERLSRPLSSIPYIMCGDWNTEATGPVYASAFAHDEGLASAYNTGLRAPGVGAEEYARGEPEFTTWKFRKSEGSSEVSEKKRTIDYIWTSPSLQAAEVWQLPSQAEIGASGLPSAAYPSDHLSLAVKLVWRK